MLSFNNFLDAVNVLIDHDNFLGIENLLQQNYNWIGIVKSRLREINDDEFFDLSYQLQNPISTPKVFPLYKENKERYYVFANLFDPSTHMEAILKGECSPHYHRFNFISKILYGSYYQWIYEKKDSRINHPQLKIIKKHTLRAGDSYNLTSDLYHFISLPAPNTITLMIWGKLLGQAPYELKELSKPVVLDNKKNFVSLLDKIENQ